MKSARDGSEANVFVKLKDEIQRNFHDFQKTLRQQKSCRNDFEPGNLEVVDL